MSAPTLQRVVLALPSSTPLDWPAILRLLARNGYPACVPHSGLPVRRHGLAHRLATWRPSQPPQTRLLDPIRNSNGTTNAAGGPIGDLDLHALAAHARATAEARWWTWHHTVATTTRPAKPWDHFLDLHQANPTRFTLDQARTRFEAQPRVLAMLAHNVLCPTTTQRFQIDELDAYQAGHLPYITLHWQQSLTGDALIDPRGTMHQPASPSLADRLRYLAAASRIIHRLTPHDRLIAVRTQPAT